MSRSSYPELPFIEALKERYGSLRKAIGRSSYPELPFIEALQA